MEFKVLSMFGYPPKESVLICLVFKYVFKLFNLKNHLLLMMSLLFQMETFIGKIITKKKNSKSDNYNMKTFKIKHKD